MVEGPTKQDDSVWYGRTSGNRMILFPKDESFAIGDIVMAKVDKAQTWIVKGTLVK